MGRTIDADVLKAAFETDGYLSPYMQRMIDACPTVRFSIVDLKRALVEVKELCGNIRCKDCPFHKTDEANIPYCPMHEDEEGTNINHPEDWIIDDWKEDGKDG